MASKWVWVMFLFMFVFIENCWSEGCWTEERFALLRLKRSINYPSSSLASWVERDENLDCCQWEWVRCNETTGRVIYLWLSSIREGPPGEWYLNASLFSPFQELKLLDLRFNNLSGWVENEGLGSLSQLNNLKFLYLSYNLLNDSILSSLDGLSSLRELHLSNNKLKGSIGIKGLSSLELLDLSYNSLNRNFLSNLNSLSSLRHLYLNEIGLKGTFDIQELDFLNNLEELSIDSNAIDNFVVPKGLSNLEILSLSGNSLSHNLLSNLIGLSSLRSLYLAEIGLKGTFDIQELDFLGNLEELDMSFNAIENFVVPKDYRGLRKLHTLHLSEVRITDGSTLLQSMGSFPSLRRLYLEGNNFTGTVINPTELHNFTNLEELILDDSSLNISFLQSITAFNSLKSLRASYCNFDDISNFQGLCGLVDLQTLHITNTNLRGTLPWCLANMTSLQVLDLSSNQLTGNISSSPLNFLTSIKELILSENHFQIPISLKPFYNHSNLTSFNGENNHVYAEIESHFTLPKFQLRHLILSGYGNGGTFPKFLYHQHELQEVVLSHLNLIGEFPNWLVENNTKLRTLLLFNNTLSGSFQLPIRPHRQLTTIVASNNFFEGQIPVDIGAYLPSLIVVNISKNAFNGSIPSSFGNMNLLERLDLSHNQLTGEIPKSIAMGCLSLRILTLSNNSLQGHIFSKNFSLTNLTRLQLDDNNFIGEIPESLSNCSLLRGLYLSNNHLSGEIPGWLGLLPNLEDIIMPNNHLEGPIPTEFCQLQVLKVLELSNNSIFGSLPSCFSPFSIEQVHLSRNKIEGQIKDIFLYSSSMVTLDLSYNRLNGSIPNWIDRLSQLNYLILASNSFEGEIPIQLCQLNKLRLVDLSHNNLFGQIPACLDNTALQGSYENVMAPAPYASSSYIDYTSPTGAPMGGEEAIPFTTKTMSYYYKGKPLNDMFGIDFSCNKLTGEIPSQIGYLTRIRALNLSHNNLTRSIPLTFSNLKQIESLDLSYNKLNGRVPSQLVELNALAFFSVAYNNLSGKIPKWTAQFATFNVSSYEGNALLCGPPLLNSCNEIGSPSSIPKASTSYGEDNSLIDMNSFYITFTASYVIVLLGLFIVLYINSYWRQKWFYLVETWIISCYYFVVDHLPRRCFH